MATLSSTTVAILRISGSTFSAALHVACHSSHLTSATNLVSADESQPFSSDGNELLTDCTTLRSVLIVNAFWQNLC